MKKICEKCGKEYEGEQEDKICLECAQEQHELIKREAITFQAYISSSAALFNMGTLQVAQAAFNVYMTAMKGFTETEPELALKMLEMSEIHIEEKIREIKTENN